MKAFGQQQAASKLNSLLPSSLTVSGKNKNTIQKNIKTHYILRRRKTSTCSCPRTRLQVR
jgi:hypothetical protein